MNDRSWGRFAASLGALVGVVVGIPAFLIACSRIALGVGHPVPGVGSIDEITEWVNRELSTTEMVPILLRTLLCVGWLLWALLLMSVIAAVVRSRPRFSHWSVPSLSLFDGFAGWIAVGLTALSSLAPNLAAVATDGPPLPAAAEVHKWNEDATSPATNLAPRPGTPVPDGYVRVESGEAITMLAERVLGSADRWEELWELRHDQLDSDTGSQWTQPWRLEAGWLLKLPAQHALTMSSGSQSSSSDEPPSAANGELDRRTHVVQDGDSIWQIAAGIADRHDLRTTEVVNALLDANLGQTMNDGQRFTDPARIGVGWSLTIPNSVVSGAPDNAETFDGGGSAESHVAYVVVEGDTLSGIADKHAGDPDFWPEIWEANRGEDMGGGRTFDDPDLILPGWQLDVPTWADNDAAVVGNGAPSGSDGDADGSDDEVGTAPDDDPVATPADDGPAGENDESAADDAAPSASDAAPAPVDTPIPATTTPATTTPATTTPATPTATADGATETPVDAEEPATAASDASDASDDAQPATSAQPPSTTTTTTSTTSTTVPPAIDPGEAGSDGTVLPASPSAPSPIRLEHAALLAAGILTLVGVRRRRRLRAALPRARVPAPPPEVAATERRLRTVEPGERAARVDIAVRGAAHHLVETEVRIGVVRLSRDGEIVLRLTGPAQLAAPWIGLGADWTLPGSIPIEMLADDARQVGNPCLALVQIGVDSDEREVLVDLEAAGLTAIEAQPDQADDVVRAIATGLASSLTSEVTHLVAAALNPECFFDHPNAYTLRSVDAAIETAVSLVGSTMTNERATFDLRALRTGGEMWEPAVLLFTSDDEAGDHITVDDLPPAGHGLATVATTRPDQFPSAGLRVEAHADRWELVGFGERFAIVPIGVSSADVAEITAVLEDAAMPIESVEFDDGPVHELAADPGDDVDVIEQPFEVVPHEVVVGLLGGIEVRSRDGQPGSFERSKTVELLAWLATHRERATRTAARTALWELDVRDATFANVVSEARRALGRLVDPPADEEWLARTLNESLPLHELVVTDADLVQQRLDHARLAAPAQAIDVLRPAVEMIRDMPFAGTSYLWPDADGITSTLVLLATTVSAELAGHALSVGDTEAVFWATGQGLKVLPGHEELIALRMRAHARAGDLAGVRQEWASYERVIVADSWSDGEPAPKLLDLRRELLSTNG